MSGPSMRKAFQGCRVRSANTAANAGANRQIGLNSAIKLLNSPIVAVFRVFAGAFSLKRHHRVRVDESCDTNLLVVSPNDPRSLPCNIGLSELIHTVAGSKLSD